MSGPVCDYCGNPSELVRGKVMYPHIHKLHGIPMWACMPCRAWCGCHPGTEIPLGRLANSGLRKAKMAAHAAFDSKWKGKGSKVRRESYYWLSKELGIDFKDCHIGMMDEAMCARVVEVCQ